MIFFDFRILDSLFHKFYDLVKQGNYHVLLDRSTNIFSQMNKTPILGRSFRFEYNPTRQQYLDA